MHDLHIWTVTSGFPALSAHVLVGQESDCHAARARLAGELSERFGIDHTTLQVDHVSEARSLELGLRFHASDRSGTASDPPGWTLKAKVLRAMFERRRWQELEARSLLVRAEGAAVAVTILDGSTFCISDENGDIAGSTSGLFASDTRFLSLLRLTINGEPPLHLSSGRVDYFSAAFYLRNPLAGGLPQDALTISRHRFVGDNLQETIVVENETMSPLSFELAIEIGTDFADIMSVKEHDFTLGHPSRRAAPAAARRLSRRRRAARVRLLRLGRGEREDAHPGHPLHARRLRRRTRRPLPARARAARPLGDACRRRPLARGRDHLAAAARAPLRRGAPARLRRPLGLEAERAPAARRAGTSSSTRSGSRSRIWRRCGCAAATRGSLACPRPGCPGS